MNLTSRTFEHHIVVTDDENNKNVASVHISDAAALIELLRKALTEIELASRPTSGPVTPGRYKFGGETSALSYAVVLAVIDGRAFGYHELDGVAHNCLQWNAANGQYGNGDHAHMNLASRLPDQSPTITPIDWDNPLPPSN